MNSEPKISDIHITPASDEKMFALFAHLSIILGGFFIPLVFWLTNKDRSKFVAFHSLQAIFYHLALIFLVIVWVFIIIFLSFGMFFPLPSLFTKNTEIPSFYLILFFIMYGLIYLFALLFIIYGVYVAVKSYEGKLIKYPVIGKIIYKQIYSK